MSEEGNEGVRIIEEDLNGLIRSFKRKDGIVVIDKRRCDIEKHGAK